MCKCCSDHKRANRDKLYEFLHGHEHKHTDQHGESEEQGVTKTRIDPAEQKAVREPRG
ncbi:MAG: hypothetical protein JRF69_04390 [Deltaproteobacteria bacterium]|nr:hypothetical protein [Deltaproteobacteria bacterium]